MEKATLRALWTPAGLCCSLLWATNAWKRPKTGLGSCSRLALYSEEDKGSSLQDGTQRAASDNMLVR